MIHDLTIGHFDPAGIPQRRRTVLKPLEMHVVDRLLKELGGSDAEGHPTLGDVRVRFVDGYIVVPRLGGWIQAIVVLRPFWCPQTRAAVDSRTKRPYP